MSVKRPVYIKQLLLVPALALFSIAFFSSCQKVSSSSTDIGDWSQADSYDGPTRTQPVCFVINNIAYAGTGYNGQVNARFTDFFRFDESTSSWYQETSLPGTARNLATAFTVNGKGYVVGGFDGTNFLSDVWEFDPNGGPLDFTGNHTGSWTSKGRTPFPGRYGAVSFGIGDTGYVVSGFDSTLSYKKDMWKYIPASNTWIQGADLGNNKRMSAVSFVFNNQGYVVTGVNNGNYVNDLWAYSPSTGAWSERRKIADLNDSSYDAAYGNNIFRSDASVFLINDTAYLTNGNYNAVIGSTWAYDIGHDQWFQKTNFEGTAREGGIGFTVNNHGYFGLGSSGSQYFEDIWQFLPDAAQTNNDN